MCPGGMKGKRAECVPGVWGISIRQHTAADSLQAATHWSSETSLLGGKKAAFLLFLLPMESVITKGLIIMMGQTGGPSYDT